MLALSGDRSILALPDNWVSLAAGCWALISLGPKEHVGCHVRALAPAFPAVVEGSATAAGGKAVDKHKHPHACGHAALRPPPPEHERSNNVKYIYLWP